MIQYNMMQHDGGVADLRDGVQQMLIQIIQMSNKPTNHKRTQTIKTTSTQTQTKHTLQRAKGVADLRDGVRLGRPGDARVDHVNNDSNNTYYE